MGINRSAFPGSLVGMCILVNRQVCVSQRRKRRNFEAFVDESEGPFEEFLKTKDTYGGGQSLVTCNLGLFKSCSMLFDSHQDNYDPQKIDGSPFSL